MRDKLLSLPGVESGEESMVSMLLTQSVFLGIFFGTFDISAHSQFLSIFDEKMMAKGYVISGSAGIILTALYTRLQSRMKFKNFAIINLAFVTSLSILLWIAIILSPSKWVIFLLFIMLGPLNILAALGFWDTAGRLFSFRQGKRFFRLVDAGLVVGIILSCFAIPVLLSFHLNPHNILLLSALSVMTATFVQIIIGSKFSLVRAEETWKGKKDENKKSMLTVFREVKNIRIMGIFVAMSVVSAFFIQYSFMAVTREQYPSEEDMAGFLAIFTGGMMIFTLLVRLLLFPYLIRNYGLRTCLSISPVIVAVFTLFAVIIGMIMGFAPEAANGFIIFFLLLAMSRLFSKALKESIETPSFEVIYLTIDEKIRNEIKSLMKGTVNEIAALSSGLMLAGLGLLSFIKLIQFSWVLFIFLIIWGYIAVKLYDEYRKSVRKALGTGNELAIDRISNRSGGIKNRFAAESAFRNDYFKLLSGDFSSLDGSMSPWYFRKIIDHSSSMNDTCLIPLLKKLNTMGSVAEDDRRLSGELVKRLESVSTESRAETGRLVSARNILTGSRIPQTTEILRLLRNNSIDAKRLGIFIIGKFRLTDLLPEVCDCLNIKGLETDAFSILKTFGNEAGSELERSYLASSGHINTSKSILKLLGGIKTRESRNFLFSRLWSNSRVLKESAISLLIDMEFKPDDDEKVKLNQLVSETIGIMTWILSARKCIEGNNDPVMLKVIDKELFRWRTYLFDLLSVTYSRRSVVKIRENLDRETVESISFALEMIDILIDETLKTKLILLLDAVPDEEKLKNLYKFYPVENPEYNKLMEDILNRDYNLVSIWTKASVLKNICDIEGETITESVVALLFSPEDILQEESARLISRSGKELFRSISHRLSDSSRKRLGRIAAGEVPEEEFLLARTNFLSACFPSIPEEELLSLAGELKYNKDFGSLSSVMTDNMIIWPFTGTPMFHRVHVVHKGNLSETGLNAGLAGSISYYSLSLSAFDDFNYQHPGSSFEIFKYIETNEV